ncbi:DNA polymerase III subunit epsilon [Alsobacter sp. SYSU M60028]|uniref:DNA polymerase III subunit epsilon n=1 Tax=Alsobacter ponti TaxID=2962936 RepID=A0ABT1LB44_9HYPH|nr:DNA polymerase III subunit epsilon [Alsobacter ponti]MCP8938649.1 DNA polymerase III subunit epsilon [Alsobacter ponti]
MAVREIVFDTETTGLSPHGGDRIVEIGCVEMLNHIPTGATFHVYINPERDMPEEAFAVHGLSSAFLADKPVFAQICDDFLAFVGDARLVAHNAAFDMGFVNAEIGRLGRPPIDEGRVVDTLALARRRNPFGSNSLDALCQRYGIDNSRRVKHGALLDAEILADVYVELLGGRQADLGLSTSSPGAGVQRVAGGPRQVGARPEPLPPRLTEAEIAAHAAFVATLGGGTPVWGEYMARDEAAVGATA